MGWAKEGGQAVFSQILTRFMKIRLGPKDPVKVRLKSLKSCVLEGAGRTLAGSEK